METTAFISFVLMWTSALAMFVCGELFKWYRGVRMFCYFTLLNALVFLAIITIAGVMKINT